MANSFYRGNDKDRVGFLLLLLFGLSFVLFFLLGKYHNCTAGGA